MTIDEIKSVSILQWMRENNYGDGVRKGRNYFFCSPLRSERTPSFAVNPAENLWCDFGDNRNGGNLIFGGAQSLDLIADQCITQKIFGCDAGIIGFIILKSGTSAHNNTDV